MFLQGSDGGKAVNRVSGKTADRLRDDQVDLPGEGIGYHAFEALTLFGVRPGDALVYLNAVFDTNGKASSGAQSAGKGLISWAFAVLPIYPTGLRKPCFSFQ